MMDLLFVQQILTHRLWSNFFDTFLIKSSACRQSLRDSRHPECYSSNAINMLPQVVCKMGLLIFLGCVYFVRGMGERVEMEKLFLGETWWLFTPDTGRGGGKSCQTNAVASVFFINLARGNHNIHHWHCVSVCTANYTRRINNVQW